MSPAPAIPEHLTDAFYRLRRYCGFTVPQASALCLAGFDVVGFVVLP